MGVKAHIDESSPGPPAKFPVGERGVCVTLWRVAGSARDDLVGDRNASGLFISMDHLENGMASTGTEVVDLHSRRGMGQRGDVPFGQIGNMDVVANGSTIRGGVIPPEDIKFGTTSDRDLTDARHQVVRHTSRVFSDFAARICTDGIKIAEDRYRKLGCRGGDIGKNQLTHQFRAAVRVDTTGRLGFLQWNIRALSVNRGT